MTGTQGPDTGLVRLDGSEGEGGGQILRSALSLSLITGRPFHITRLRERRDPPGLRPQHLACVRGAEALCGGAASSEGATVGASELSFTPAPVRAGDYLLEVGTAGSTPLLFQCLVYPLALAGGGRLTLRGGTHLPHSPSFHYVATVWQPVAHAYGLPVLLSLVHAGFYPEGAGEIVAEVGPPQEPPRLVELPARGMLREVRVSSFTGGLPFTIAERQSRAAVGALRERGILAEADNRPLAVTRSVGTVTFVLAQFEHTIAGFTALGERGRPAEEVGREGGEALARFMETGGALDEHLADQILLPAALLAAGRLGPAAPGTTRFTAARITDHLTTHARVVERFLPVRVTVDAGGSVEVRPA
ncbi:RNA 3'-terminal phosphate cyclase [Myxococcus xanthus]|uniref:RNA 3'-terminal phosphate cyclase n=1 Tax=Myxococcus xanthus TaxID=34 RepID=A0A7Y4ICZ4_MYXXA|nr:RNA 3'-terminal phosphate cyclase [Myxococcus xanthus]NOJ76952.1 RNA 3'-phosphate cyclase [Myxococcus xanthus]NOJ84557.1 RNA 3'-phosphate cyclase [Myxococcus xanthus]